MVAGYRRIGIGFAIGFLAEDGNGADGNHAPAATLSSLKCVNREYGYL
jgi:hypothetical protein